MNPIENAKEIIRLKSKLEWFIILNLITQGVTLLMVIILFLMFNGTSFF
jgi:hypothetical protein